MPLDLTEIVAIDDDPHGKLTGVHPDLVLKVEQLLVVLRILGLPMIVTAGVRTEAEQAALYAQGRTAPGKIVTNADGVTNRSNHQVKADGYGHAVDCAFRDAAGQPTWDPSYPWRLYGTLAMQLGLKWGGAWSAITDLPHVELP